MDRMGWTGVALGVYLSAFVKVTLLYAIWKHRTKNRESGAVYARVGKMILLSIFLGAVVEGMRRFISSWLNTQTLSGAFSSSMLAGLLFLTLLYPTCRALKMDDFLAILNRPIQKVKELLFR